MSVGRFAGAELGKFMGSGVKFGELSQTERDMNSQMNAETSLSDAQVGAAGITAAADVAANKMIQESQAKLGVAQSQASGMQSMVSGIMGGFG